MSGRSPPGLVKLVQSELRARADPDRVEPMQRYMKTTMPFYGVQATPRKDVLRAVKTAYRPTDIEQYGAVVDTLWALPHREEKYLALDYATAYKKFVIDRANLPRFERMVREGGWWDFVDLIAARLIGRMWAAHRAALNPVIDAYVADEDMWIRRTSLLAHLGHKQDTDEERLYATILQLAPEKEFFIRKAIGWVLREYSKTRPERVRAFVDKNASSLSGLSLREARKYL